MFYLDKKKARSVTRVCSECNILYTGNKYSKCTVYYCSNTCRSQGMLKRKDLKGSTILNLKTDIDFYYLIGLICTDGHIQWPNCQKSKCGYNVSIELQYNDKKIIEQIFNKFGGKLFITKYKTGTIQIRWSLSNKSFIDYLRQIGITNNKSKTLNVDMWFNSLNEDYKISFIRGVLDGDGCVYLKPEMSKYLKMNCSMYICTASASFSQTIYNYLEKYGAKLHNHKIYSIHLYGNNAIKFLDYVYSVKSEFKILRKYETYNNMKLFKQSTNKKEFIKNYGR